MCRVWETRTCERVGDVELSVLRVGDADLYRVGDDGGVSVLRMGDADLYRMGDEGAVCEGGK